MDFDGFTPDLNKRLCSRYPHAVKAAVLDTIFRFPLFAL